MDFRSHMLTPLQHTGVWIAAWLYGLASYDDAACALAGGGDAVDVEFFRRLRAEVGQALEHGAEPVVSLVFPGPGDAQLAATQGMPVLAVRTANPGHALLLAHPVGSAQWLWVKDPLPSVLNPGEAEFELSEATRRAAELIDTRGLRSGGLSDPRLAVAMLSDAYGAVGFPDATAPRAAKLIARADQVSAIVEVVVQHAQDHSFDAELLALTRPIRQARMAAVSYAVAEFARRR